ncbi:MAG: thioredoxin family protein [Gammaproteobacteria bacterium]|nr:thioredoxin family protein [Gammaproteobacteria bacterium]MBU0773508.1 thioredoxin family protein [Gammaproteobacteria bacterium]MBU0857729.1 thioredoxin family protein [Gammaproteobacteria bacterium]MBU1848145.1 thioredoxin family protein [Gammaproteobacteria bacterium]
MKRILPVLFAALLASLSSRCALALESAPVVSPRAKVTLVSSVDTAGPDAALELGLRFVLSPGWHIYWMNPGDAGQAPAIDLYAPDASVVSDIRWPAPKVHVDGPVTTFVHEGNVLLPFGIKLPATTTLPVNVAAKARWLVCKDICIPEEGVFRLVFPAGPAKPSSAAPQFDAARVAEPAPSPYRATVGADGTLSLRGDDVSRIASARFFPADWGMVEHGAAQPASAGDGAFRLALTTGPAFDAAQQLAGVLLIRDRDGAERAQWIATAGTPAARAAAVRRVADALPADVPGAMNPSPPTSGPAPPFLHAVLLALAGGVLLNLMPCVFPVLAIKALSLTKMGTHARAAVRMQSLAYGAGVTTTFMLLAMLLLALRAAGTQAGWGFQFQSPLFVAAMAVLLSAIGLNLSGVFDISGRVVHAGDALAARDGLSGSFFTGALAVVVATPCTAPFMGGAIAAALTAPAGQTLAIFAALGAGMALPYLLLGFFPALAQYLPRPGSWTLRLKQALAFPMYGAAVWLVWVLGKQTGADGVLWVLIAIVLLALAAWLFGVAQSGAARAGVWRLASVLALSPVFVAVGQIPDLPSQTAAQGEDGVQAFAPQRLAQLRAEGEPVFVNMTAAWCVTCLMNEKVALSRPAVRQAFEQQGIHYLKGDWTRADPAITEFLRAHGRDGVPLYVFFPPDGAPPVVLPQILTEGIVLERIGT